MSELAARNVETLSGRPSFWRLHRGESSVIATAIHDGHHIDEAILSHMAVDEEARLREEDPFTGFIIAGVPNRLVCFYSRFCVDLNRPRDKAVYLSPTDAWGLKIWNENLRNEAVSALRLLHDEYYLILKATLEGVARRNGKFVVVDVHSYNHRRDGPENKPTVPDRAPDINIGTFSMDRERWAHVVDPFMEFCATRSIRGRRLDVRENIAFEGRGEQTRFIHQHFPETGCAIAVEFKKFFMDEWTGEPDTVCLQELQALITAAVPLLENALKGKPT